MAPQAADEDQNAGIKIDVRLLSMVVILIVGGNFMYGANSSFGMKMSTVVHDGDATRAQDVKEMQETLMESNKNLIQQLASLKAKLKQPQTAGLVPSLVSAEVTPLVDKLAPAPAMSNPPPASATTSAPTSAPTSAATATSTAAAPEGGGSEEKEGMVNWDPVLDVAVFFSYSLCLFSFVHRVGCSLTPDPFFPLQDPSHRYFSEFMNVSSDSTCKVPTEGHHTARHQIPDIFLIFVVLMC